MLSLNTSISPIAGSNQERLKKINVFRTASSSVLLLGILLSIVKATQILWNISLTDENSSGRGDFPWIISINICLKLSNLFTVQDVLGDFYESVF